MESASHPPGNAFVRRARTVYNRMGFSKGYNFILFVIFGGAFLGFTLARLQFLSFNGVFCQPNGAAPGECYWYTNFLKYKVGIILHLSTILPAAFLAFFQFIPAIRHKLLIFHRINGWTITVLVICSSAGAIIITPHAFGGDLSVQAGVGVLVIMTLLGLAMAIYNVKRYQIEQHRAWMLRTWFYFGSIITLRIILILGTLIISRIDRYRLGVECAKIDYMMQNSSATLEAYPDCASYYDGSAPDQMALVQADLNGSEPTAAAGLDLNFGAALWLALWLHAVGVEIYLHLTPREAQRLRQISYQKQLEAGLQRPGSAGLTSDRLGDDEAWKPALARHDTGDSHKSNHSQSQRDDLTDRQEK